MIITEILWIRIKVSAYGASTLGAGFDPEDIRAVIAGERPLPEFPKDAPPPIRQVGLIIDIQQRMAEGKGPAYERWAKVYNLSRWPPPSSSCRRTI